MVKHVPLLFALALAGCASTEFNPVPGSPVHAPYRGEVRVLDGFPADGTHEQVGIIIAEGVYITDKEDLIEDIKAEAARRGADAVVLQGDVRLSRTPAGGEIKKLGAYAFRLKP